MDLKKVSVRAGSGLVYIALVTGLICCGYPGVLALVALFTILATLEFDLISAIPRRKLKTVITCDVCANLCLGLSCGPQVIVLLPMWFVLLLVRYLIELYGHEEQPVRSLATSLMSTIYIGLPMFCLSAIAAALAMTAPGLQSISDNPFISITPLWPLLAIFVLIWLNDTGAFIVGSLVGRHKMSPTISPKKTWEGFFGGMFFTVAAAVISGLCIFTSLEIPWWVLIIYGILVSVFATWGDLTESLIKRNLGLKDSGTIMPGHGGILDRIDSLLFVMPLTFFFVLIITILNFLTLSTITPQSW